MRPASPPITPSHLLPLASDLLPGSNPNKPQSKALYDSPLSDRASCPEHVAFGVSRLEESEGAGDLKENFSFGRYAAPFTETQQKLPPVLEKNKAEMLAFQRKCFEATCKLLDAFSLALNVSPFSWDLTGTMEIRNLPLCDGLQLPVDFFRQKHSLGGCAVTLINCTDPT